MSKWLLIIGSEVRALVRPPSQSLCRSAAFFEGDCRVYDVVAPSDCLQDEILPAPRDSCEVPALDCADWCPSRGIKNFDWRAKGNQGNGISCRLATRHGRGAHASRPRGHC